MGIANTCKNLSNTLQTPFTNLPMSEEFEVEVEIDAGVEVEIEVEAPEVEIEVDFEAPEVEIEIEIEAPEVEIEIEVEAPEVEIEVEFEVEVQVEAPEVEIEVQVELPTSDMRFVEAPEVDIEVSGQAMELTAEISVPMVALEVGGHSYEDETYNKACCGICLSVALAIVFWVLFIFSGILGGYFVYNGLQKPRANWGLIGSAGIALPLLLLIGAVISCCCCFKIQSKSRRDAQSAVEIQINA